MNPATRFLTVVIRLPDDPRARDAVVCDFRLFEKYKGADVTALYAGDAITENELLEQHVPRSEVRLIREQAGKDLPSTATMT